MQKDSSILDQIRSLKDSVNSLSQKISEIERKQTASITFQVTANLSVSPLISNGMEMSSSKEYRGYIRFLLEEIPFVVSNDNKVDALLIKRSSISEIICNKLISTLLEKDDGTRTRESLENSLILKSYVVSGGADSLSRPVMLME